MQKNKRKIRLENKSNKIQEKVEGVVLVPIVEARLNKQAETTRVDPPRQEVIVEAHLNKQIEAPEPPEALVIELGVQ